MKLFIVTYVSAGENYTPKVFLSKEEAMVELESAYQDELMTAADAVANATQYNDKTFSIEYTDDTYLVAQLFEIENKKITLKRHEMTIFDCWDELDTCISIAEIEAKFNKFPSYLGQFDVVELNLLEETVEITVCNSFYDHFDDDLAYEYHVVVIGRDEYVKE